MLCKIFLILDISTKCYYNNKTCNTKIYITIYINNILQLTILLYDYMTTVY